jgi:hypothetical protein
VRKIAFQNGNGLSAQYIDKPGLTVRSASGRSAAKTFHIETYWMFDSITSGARKLFTVIRFELFLVGVDAGK